MSIPWPQVAVALLGAALLAGLIYAAVLAISFRKRGRPRLQVAVAEYALIGWVIMFVFVTQVLAFGNSMGARFNLLPLGALYDAWNYGLVNAGTLPQFALNIVMTAPLGILLPLVFPQRITGFLRIGAAGFAVSLVAELAQLVTGRSADIDDVIANTLGVLVGYSLLCLVRAVVRPAARRPRTRILAAALVVVLAVAPFVAVWAKDASDPVGSLYYGHLRPANVDVSTPLSTETSTGTVYRYVQQESPEELLARLSKLTGFTDCESGVDEYTSGICTGKPDERLFTFPYGRWSVNYAYADASEIDPALVPDEAAALTIAEEAMRDFGIDPGSLVYEGELKNWGGGSRYLEFSAEPGPGPTMLWGPVRVIIGENGALLGLEDRRATFEPVREVTTISSRAALQLAQDVGVDQFSGTAKVTDVARSFAFNEQTGYLVPSWQFTGTFAGTEWTPNMDARQR